MTMLIFYRCCTHENFVMTIGNTVSAATDQAGGWAGRAGDAVPRNTNTLQDHLSSRQND